MRRAAGLLLGLAVAGCAAGRPAPAPLPPPAPGRPPVISGFGDPRPGGGPGGRRHLGIDIRVPAGTPVLAAADGTVSRVSRWRRAGKLVVLRHGDDLATVYYHLAEILVEAGQAVRRGEVLGRSGRTGNATTPHLHFGVCRHPQGDCGRRIGAAWVDPAGRWVEGNPCFASGRDYGRTPERLTYPVPCGG